MKCKIVADSSCDLSPELLKKMDVELVPLTLQLGDKVFTDDENLDLDSYLLEMRACPTPPKTSCPSPSAFMNSFAGDDKIIFVVTLSSKLSGTYNSARLARDMFLDEHKDYFIHVFDSLSAASGESLIAMKIFELAQSEEDPNELVRKVEAYINGLKTLFLLDDVNHLAKNGRLNPVIAKIASALSIKLILGSDGKGEIKLMTEGFGYDRAFKKLLTSIGQQGLKLEERTLVIGYVLTPERGQRFYKEVMMNYKFKDVVVVKMGGLSSTYADIGGLVIAF
jgi:DegV family protein with EDD domain